GGGSLREGWVADLSPVQVAELLEARVLAVVPYLSELQVVDDLVTARVRFGPSLAGAVVNRVPGHRRPLVAERMRPFLAERGIRLFAVLPRDRLLQAVSVGEILEGLGGRVLCARDHMDALVEHLMVGAMSAESALAYFRRRPNKAVITGGDRPDIQLAAIETSTRCLVLTGNLHPPAPILGKAEQAGIPILLTPHDTLTAVEIIESFFGKGRWHQAEKVQRMEELLAGELDFDALAAALEPGGA
ncbi:phosphotransacetylase family protein, partial [Dissulfurirhabdus thermomarina]